MITVPCRAADVLACTASCTEPFPEPLAPALTLIHETCETEVQLQPVAAVTATEMLPPEAATVCCCGAMANEHPAVWMIVNVWPPMLSVPVRSVPVLAATLKVTEPSPEPLAPEAIV